MPWSTARSIDRSATSPNHKKLAEVYPFQFTPGTMASAALFYRASRKDELPLRIFCRRLLEPLSLSLLIYCSHSSYTVRVFKLPFTPRLQGPLLTLIATNSHEIGFAVLSHIHVILAKFVFLEAPEGQLQLPAPSRAVEQLLPSWVEDYKHFFVKWNEPTYIKKLKLDILTLLVFEKNAEPVIAEIREAVTDVSGEISKHAIHCLSRIALLNEALAAQIVQTLLELLKLDTGDGYGGAVVTETAIVMKDILRKYPEQFDEVPDAF